VTDGSEAEEKSYACSLWFPSYGHEVPPGGRRARKPTVTDGSEAEEGLVSGEEMFPRLVPMPAAARQLGRPKMAVVVAISATRKQRHLRGELSEPQRTCHVGCRAVRRRWTWFASQRGWHGSESLPLAFFPFPMAALLQCLPWSSLACLSKDLRLPYARQRDAGDRSTAS
jgi:hypothetical protein